jgi:hypothetical protein
MYSVTIQNTSINEEGNAYASVAFSRDTGEVEQYRDLITLEDGTQEYTEILERPRIETIYKNIFFTSQENLNSQVNAEKARLDALLVALSGVPLGDFAPTPEPIPEPEPPSEEELARNAWLEQWRVYEKANRAMKALAEAGFEPTQEEQTQFDALKLWVGTNRKPEYSQYI